MTVLSLRRLSCLLVGVLALTAAIRADEPAIIAKARAFVGPEAKLDALTSVHYTGVLVTADPKDPTKQTRANIEIIFQKPDQQRITATSDRAVEVTALDDYEAWQRIQDAKDPSKWRQTLLAPEQVRRLQANTWENLAFFRGIERKGGRVDDQGPATIDGVACEKIAFIHSPTISFIRYFALDNGKLIYTETESGGSIREQGEMMVDGIRFPMSLATQTRNSAGEMQTVTINFDKITVNEVFPSSLFSVPELGKK